MAEDSSPKPVEGMSPSGQRIRVAVTLFAALLLIVGSVWGQDDDFPFGPFRMYATTANLNSPAPDTRVEATEATGAVVPLTEGNTGIRRAEIEGQMGRFKADPALLKVVWNAYARRNPKAPEVRRVQIVIRWHELRQGLPTGAWWDEVVTTWTR
jgi:hypothetical protein